MKKIINWLKRTIFGKRKEKKKQIIFNEHYYEMLNSTRLRERMEEKKKIQKETYDRILRSQKNKRSVVEERIRRNEIDSDNNSLNIIPVIFYDTDDRPTSSPSQDDFTGNGGEFGGGGSSGSWESDSDSSSSSDSDSSGCSSCSSGCGGGGCGGGD